MQKKTKLIINKKWLSLALAVGLVIVVISLVASKKKVEGMKACGYTFANGFGLQCDCQGELIKEKDTEGKVSQDGFFEYCKGKAAQEVCFKEFEGFKPLKPYICSDFPYEVEIIPASSTDELGPLYQDTKYVYRVKEGSDELTLETKEEVKCDKLRVMGFVEMIKMSSYQGMRMYGEKFRCLD